jgi:hypothetical protein
LGIDEAYGSKTKGEEHMTDKELLQQALDALKMSYELQYNGLINFEEYKLISDADILIRLIITIEAIKARLAKPEKEWVGLTDEEVKILTTQNRTDFSRPPYEEFYRAIEAKLKEKNT